MNIITVFLVVAHHEGSVPGTAYRVPTKKGGRQVPW